MTRPKGALNKESALKQFSLRIPQEVYDYFKEGYDKPSGAMRAVLEEYARTWRNRERL